MKHWLLTGLLLLSLLSASQTNKRGLNFFGADNSYIQYTGRIDFGNPQLPRFWQPGVYITLRFKGRYCEIILNDEILWGRNHNYIEVVVDGKAARLQTGSARDTIIIGDEYRLEEGAHTVILSKNTEANIGYLELVGVRCRELLPPAAAPKRKMEFIGNSITCGASSDPSVIPCGKGVWQDQHNAWLSYGAVTARTLNAQYHLSAVSGIGLMHSCCNLDIIMPQVFDKVSMRDNKITWDFSQYQPDAVTVCLGQNDGVQDSALFCDNYISFLRTLRKHYPKAAIFCLSSPMADTQLTAFMKRTITSIVEKLNAEGDRKITKYFFRKQYRNGCDWHPDINEHRQIAEELVAFVRETMKW